MIISNILVINAGSSSLKFAVFSCDAPRGLSEKVRGRLERDGQDIRLCVVDTSGKTIVDETRKSAKESSELALRMIYERVDRLIDGRVDAAGHRIVHGGTRFTASVRIDASVLAALEELTPLAPLHQPDNLAAIRALIAIDPDLSQVACFDTAFHWTQPEPAQHFALPRELFELEIRRYGFHGLSYEYIVSVLPSVLNQPAVPRRVVIAHLGNGASLCALREGKSVATTMSFSTLDGIPMGTRCGNIDPGVLIYLMTELEMDVSQVSDLLYHRSGLLGLSGISHDVRQLLASDDPRASQAIEILVYWIGRELGSMAAALGGLDTLVFTGGIGEHAAPVRARVCRHASWLGVRLDESANARGGPRISIEDSPVSVLVIPTDEERTIAEHTYALVSGEER
ncbi:MAG: acetate/propionate family kinase [Gammaproteobacteria bacterium]